MDLLLEKGFVFCILFFVFCIFYFACFDLILNTIRVDPDRVNVHRLQKAISEEDEEEGSKRFKEILGSLSPELVSFWTEAVENSTSE